MTAEGSSPRLSGVGSADFDPIRLLDVSVSLEPFFGDRQAAAFGSVDEFEENLLTTDPDTVRSLLRLDRRRTRSDGAAEADKPELPSGAERLRSVQALVARRSRKDRPTEATVAKASRRRHTVVSRIEEGAFEGPLALLCRCVKERWRVRVWVRARAGVRSQLTATVVAFDKHWNLALRDVDELYYKPNRTRVFRAGKAETPECVPKELLYTSEQKRITAKVELMRRHLNQLIVKGDNVVMIAVA